jgi:hypothetical protein
VNKAELKKSHAKMRKEQFEEASSAESETLSEYGEELLEMTMRNHPGVTREDLLEDLRKFGGCLVAILLPRMLRADSEHGGSRGA